MGAAEPGLKGTTVSVIYEYFLAENDAAAALTADWTGGPTQPPASHAALEAADLPGLEPSVAVGMLYELLGGSSWEGAVDTDDIASRDGGELIVLRMSEPFQQLLASVEDEQLRSVMGDWSNIEEFWGEGDPEALLPLARELVRLARMGRETGRRLYCWVCV